jgi:hypothetical protein
LSQEKSGEKISFLPVIEKTSQNSNITPSCLSNNFHNKLPMNDDNIDEENVVLDEPEEEDDEDIEPQQVYVFCFIVSFIQLFSSKWCLTNKSCFRILSKALFKACQEGDLENVKILLQCGPN